MVKLWNRRHAARIVRISRILDHLLLVRFPQTTSYIKKQCILLHIYTWKLSLTDSTIGSSRWWILVPMHGASDVQIRDTRKTEDICASIEIFAPSRRPLVVDAHIPHAALDHRIRVIIDTQYPSDVSFKMSIRDCNFELFSLKLYRKIVFYIFHDNFEEKITTDGFVPFFRRGTWKFWT